jgi:hypothetical protein
MAAFVVNVCERLQKGKPQSNLPYSDRQVTQSTVHDIKSFREADSDTDSYLLVGNVRERLAANKQKSRRFHVHRCNLKTLEEMESKEK